jgi:hypothetical protein
LIKSVIRERRFWKFFKLGFWGKVKVAENIPKLQSIDGNPRETTWVQGVNTGTAIFIYFLNLERFLF